MKRVRKIFMDQEKYWKNHCIRYSHIRLEIVIFFLLLISFFIQIDYLGKIRDFEQFQVTASRQPEVFKNDEYAMCLLSGANNIVPWIILKTTDTSRKIIYYIMFLFSVWFLYKLAKTISKDSLVSLIFPLIIIYMLCNWISFNIYLLTGYFTGTFLAIPFIILSLKLFMDERFSWSAIFAAVAFYLSPALCLWYIIAVFSYIPVALIMSYISKDRSLVRLADIFKAAALFLVVFFILISPRLYEVFILNHSISLIDPHLRVDILKNSWANHTTLWFDFLYRRPRIPTVIRWLSNLVLFILVVHNFRKSQDKKLQIVYYMYIGSWVFLILNEIMIHVFNCSFCVIYELMRTNVFNFLFLALLLSVMIKNSFKEKRHYESFCWFLFIVNYTTIHFRAYSAIAQVVILILIALFRFTKLSTIIDFAISRLGLRNLGLHRDLYKRSLMCFTVLVVVLTGTRYLYRHRAEVSLIDYYRDAIEYVNTDNTERSVVLYPFTRYEEFFLYSKNPGFFNTYYPILFTDQYKFEADNQKRAYIKFQELEKEFGIDTLNKFYAEPDYESSWRGAWETKVNKDVIERWSRQYNIGYIIREKRYSVLPYDVVYENEGYRVYRRELRKGE